jgi:predicted nucleic acid-binding protein
MNKVLLDTVGMLAVWNVRDQWHPAAAPVFAALVAAGTDFYTTSYILLECGNAATRTPFRADVVELREQLRADGKLIEPTEADCQAEWEAYRRGQPGQAGIVDQISFAVMRRLSIIDAFTNDRHFREAGFNPLF